MRTELLVIYYIILFRNIRSIPQEAEITTAPLRLCHTALRDIKDNCGEMKTYFMQ